jgi:UDP-N-acetylglucosamine--N-acetylmuramyl-(pentapeptide) pyrophosphoryl-undecaprenol N-acetylglucosamine transferase
VTVGNPVRAEIAAIDAPAQRLQTHTGAVRLLVLGGSQGARALNEGVPQALAMLQHAAPVQVRHQCGEQLLERTTQAYAQSGIEAQIEPFIADMAQAYAWADLVVCRAGALTLAELCAAGVGSVLVPFPRAADDHQTRNAEFLVTHHAAVLVPEGEAFVARLAEAIHTPLHDASLRLALAQAARTLARVDAADRVADQILAEARA